MAIKKPPVTRKPAANGVQRGNRTLATIGFQPGVLERATRAAEDFGISRAAWINRAVKKALEESGF